jgi:hypothetical protein
MNIFTLKIIEIIKQLEKLYFLSTREIYSLIKIADTISAMREKVT